MTTTATSISERTETSPPITQKNSYTRVAFASFIGTAVEFYDFYIFGLATALFIGPLFFPTSSPEAQSLLSFLTFGVAFIARPIGSAVFGHFGDRIGRKVTLVASLLIMGVSTTLIGFLPTFESIGFFAPIMLCIFRFGQGLGLGGEWGGAALLATENAPKGKRALFGMFPQLGPPVGFIASCGIFIVIEQTLTPDAVNSWGWRIPFILSSVLVMIGLYVRMSIFESPAFQKLEKNDERVSVPFVEMCKNHSKMLVLGSLSMVACYTLFFIITVFSLQFGTTTIALYTRTEYLTMLSIAIVFMAIASPISAVLSDRYGRRPILLVSYFIIIAAGILFGASVLSTNPIVTTAYLSFGLFAMGFNFAPMGAFLPEIFPTNIRYTGASMTYNLGGILGGSLPPFAITYFMGFEQGIYYVGYYLAAVAVMSFLAVYFVKETKNVNMMS
ncbi:MFS transporter [Ignatzschineria sp. LJL83]